MEGNAIVNLVLYTHALKIVLSGPFTCEPNTVRFVTKLCPYSFDWKLFLYGSIIDIIFFLDKIDPNFIMFC